MGKQRFALGVRCIQWADYVGLRIVTPYSFSLIHFFPSCNILGSRGGSPCLFNHNEGEPLLGTPYNSSLCIGPDLKDHFFKNNSLHLSPSEGQIHILLPHTECPFTCGLQRADMAQNKFFCAKTCTERAL